MSLAGNKEVATQFLHATVRSDAVRMRELLTDDATWWVAMASESPPVERTGEEFVSFLLQLFKAFDGPFTLHLDEITAEDDRVSVTGRGHAMLKNGGRYANNYHWLLFFRDGKIVRGMEYMDTAHVRLVFGRNG